MKLPYFIKNKQRDFMLFCLLIAGILCIVWLVSSTSLIPNEQKPPNQSITADLNLAQFSDKTPNPPPTATPNKTSNPLISNVCSLLLTLSPAEETITNNADIHYTMNVKNNGAVVCQNTSISIYYANNETFASSNPTATASNYYWNIGNLNGGEQKNFSIITVGNSDGGGTEVSVDTEACATADNGKDACGDSSVAIGN